jgi:hypothetical protein
MFKALKYGIVGLFVLSLVSLPFTWPFIRMLWVFIPRIPAPDYDPPATIAEARLQDLDYLSTLTNYDRSLSESAQSEFSSAIATIENDAQDLLLPPDAEDELNERVRNRFWQLQIQSVFGIA